MPDSREVGFVDLVWLLEMTNEQYVEKFNGTAVLRAKPWMLQRNAAVALGNTGNSEAIAPLRHALTGDSHPIVRGHAAWAIGRVGLRCDLESARRILSVALSDEVDESVREEIYLSLRDLDDAEPPNEADEV